MMWLLGQMYVSRNGTYDKCNLSDLIMTALPVGYLLVQRGTVQGRYAQHDIRRYEWTWS